MRKNLFRKRKESKPEEVQTDTLPFGGPTPTTTRPNPPPYPTSIRTSLVVQPSYPNTIPANPTIVRAVELEGTRQGGIPESKQYPYSGNAQQDFYAEQQWRRNEEQQRRFDEEQQRRNQQELLRLQAERQRLETEKQRYEAEKQRQIEAEKQRQVEAQQRALEAQAQREDIQRQAVLRAEQQSREEALRMQRQKAEQDKLKKKQNASKESVKHLRELIREKYRLDVWIWSKRGVQIAARKFVEIEYKKADKILQEIQFIVNAWEEDSFEPEEWRLAKKIKEGLSKVSEQALWGDRPPWEIQRQLNRQDGEET